jgi:hypothetical protein
MTTNGKPTSRIRPCGRVMRRVGRKMDHRRGGTIDDRPQDSGSSDEVGEKVRARSVRRADFRRLPERPGDVGPTSGILTRPDGGGLIHVRSGTRGPGGTAPGLGGRTASLDSAREHAEGEAALMRHAGTPREMPLYVNKRPCGGRYGCDKHVAVAVATRCQADGPLARRL